MNMKFIDLVEAVREGSSLATLPGVLKVTVEVTEHPSDEELEMLERAAAESVSVSVPSWRQVRLEHRP